MSKFTDTLRDVFGIPRATKKKEHKRLYSAAGVNRLNKDWTTTPYSANWSLYRDLRILRARSRDMCANSAHFRKFLKMVRSNVVGPKGLQLQVRARKARGKLDTQLNKLVGEIFWQWGMPETCTVTGKLDWIGCQRLFVTQLARDGEALVQMIAPPDNPFGFALKFWNPDYLDETYNEELRDGRRIIMSVEIDANDKPIAYWLTTPASDINFTQRRARQRIRVPAEQMIHAYLVENEESQVRGVTWFHAALLEGRNLHVYKGAVIDSAKMTAMSGGFFTKESPDETEFTGQENEDGEEQDINIDFSPGSFHIVPEGFDFKQFDPKQPTQNHAEFVKTVTRDLATALGVNYFSLAGDMGDVNYSSARVGLGEERDLWRELQDFVGMTFCRRVYHAWARAALLSGKLTVDARQFAEIQNPIFRARGWRYVDPQKEITANTMALENNQATLTDILADQGIDITEFCETRKSEIELGDQYGLDFRYEKKTPAAASDPNAPEEQTPNQKKTKKPQDDAAREYTEGTYLS
jgi:lambda family phage portal protein